MNNSVNTFDGLEFQNTPEKIFLQIDSHMIFTIREQLLDPVANYPWHKN